MILITLKIICLFLAIWLGFINLGKLKYRHAIPPMNFLIMTIGIVGFVVIQFNLWR